MRVSSLIPVVAIVLVLGTPFLLPVRIEAHEPRERPFIVPEVDVKAMIREAFGSDDPYQSFVTEALAAHAAAPSFQRNIHAPPRDDRLKHYRPIDASTPERFLASLQEIEQALEGEDLEVFQFSLASLEGPFAAKVARTAHANGGRFDVSDEELFKMAYGGLHGLYAHDVIRIAARNLSLANQAEGR